GGRRWRSSSRRSCTGTAPRSGGRPGSSPGERWSAACCCAVACCSSGVPRPSETSPPWSPDLVYPVLVEFSDVIKRGRMVRAFPEEPLPDGTTGRLLRAANRAPSAGFSQGQSYLVLEGGETAKLWALFGDAFAEGTFAKLPNAPLVIIPLANRDTYLD